MRRYSGSNPGARFQIYKAFRVRHGYIIIGMIGHSRASPAAGLEAVAVQAGFDIQTSKLVEDRGVIP